MVKKKTIAVVTGIRSEYHILKPVMEAIEEHPRLNLKVLVTGTHLSKAFGSTYKLVEKDFKVTAKIKSLPNGNSLLDRVHGLGKQVSGIASVLEKINPDITCVLGDREESLSVTSACAYLNRACAHISGGDQGFGTVDDSVRHAATKLAHLHFPTTKENRKRILNLGEETWRVHAVGASGLDRIKKTPHISRSKLLASLKLSDQSFVVILQHPVSSEVASAAKHMRLTLQTISKTGMAAIIIHPNSDPGSIPMIDVIKQFKKPSNWVVKKTLNDIQWTNSLRHASALIGNSSAGLLEAPFLSCPVINIGRRQTSRKAGPNVIRVNYDKEDILKALEKTAQPSFQKAIAKKSNRHLYGDGKSGERIARILDRTPINAKLLNKKHIDR